MVIQVIKISDLFPETKTSCKDTQTLAGKIILGEMIKTEYGIENFVVNTGKNGKPYTDVCYFNISHSEDYLACAISENEIGIDIEVLRDIKPRNYYKLFSENESKYVNFSNTSQRYLMIWTRKEALLKAKGERLAFASKINTVSDDLILFDSFEEYKITTEYNNEYVISVAEKIL